MMKTKDIEETSLRGITETVNSTLRLSSNSEEYNGLDPSQHCSPVLSRSSGGSIRFPHWFPDSIIKFSSTGSHGFGEYTSSSGHHPEFAKNKTSSDAALGSSFENFKEWNAALQLKIRPPTELMDVKMKRPMQEDSTSANLVSEAEAASFSLSGSTSITKFGKTLSLDSPDQSQPIFVQESFKKAMNFHHSTLIPSQLRLFELGATVDSFEEIADGYRSYSQTTHNLFTTTKSDDADLSKQNTTFTSTVTEVSGNKSSRIQSLPPFFAQCNTGLKRKEPSSHHSNEGNRHLQHDGPSSGIQEHVGSSHELEMKSPYREAGIPLKKARSLVTKRGLLALEIVGLPSEKNCQSSQEAQSIESSPTYTWINRLKTSSTSSNHSRDSSHGKEPVVNEMPKEDEQECDKYSKESPLSHSWIKRLQKDGCDRKGSLGFSKLEFSKMESDELPKKRFPSMAAMALVGRAMNGVR